MAHNNWRFFDTPLVGNWRHLPDDLSLQRGPTIVILPDGRRLRVPAMTKRVVQAPGDEHAAKEGGYRPSFAGNASGQESTCDTSGSSGGRRAT